MSRLRQQIKSRMERAVLDFGMIAPGDRLLIAVSGGPDSLSLLHLLLDGFGIATSEYSLFALHLDLGFEQTNPRNSAILKSYFETLGIPHRIVYTDIAKRIFGPEAKKNPCFLCSMYRRRQVYEVAIQEKCTKIVYGHHQDDVIETLLLNILYGRKIGTMYPVQPVFGGRLHIIRPLVYVEESLLKRFALEKAFPELPRFCPMDGKTRREKIKKLIGELQANERYANIRKNIFKSLYHLELQPFGTLKKILIKRQNFA